VPSTGKVMLMLFWDFNRPIHKHYQNCGQTVNNAQDCATLELELKPTIHNTSIGMLSNGIVLHHDNAQTHMAAVIAE